MECNLHNVTGKLFWVSSASTYFTKKYERSKEISSKNHKLKSSQRSYKCQYYIYDLKVRQSCNDFFKPMILPKNERTNSTLLLWYLRWTCFRSIFGRNWRHQKDILTFDLWLTFSKVKFIRSFFFGRIVCLKKSLQLCLTFS